MGLSVALAAAACERSGQGSVIDGFESLPHAGAGPLAGGLPGPTAFALVMPSPRALWKAIAESPPAKALAGQGLDQDLEALPWAERLAALSARLSEGSGEAEALGALLDGPAELAWTSGPNGASGWLWLERLAPDRAALISLARLLYAVHPSGRDIELEHRWGVSIHRVRLSPTLVISYFVLADRFVASSDFTLATEALAVLLGKGTTPSPDARLVDLESSARGEPLAALWLPSAQASGSPSGGEAPFGIRSLSVVGRKVIADLDPAEWGVGQPLSLAPPGGYLRLDAPGFVGARAWQELRRRIVGSVNSGKALGSSDRTVSGDAVRLVASLDALAAQLGVGASLWVGREVAGGIAGVLALRASGDAAAALESAARLAFASEGERLGWGDGALECSGGELPALCVGARAGWVAIAAASHDARSLLESAEPRGESGVPSTLDLVGLPGDAPFFVSLKPQNGEAVGTIAFGPPPAEGP
ncbi:MAG: hypothetical protein ACYCWW_14660 [Deltaproteobacteria bacterium]